MNVVAIPPQAAELALEALTPYPVWERASRLKLEQIASERVPSRVRCKTITRSGMAVSEIVRAVVPAENLIPTKTWTRIVELRAISKDSD